MSDMETVMARLKAHGVAIETAPHMPFFHDDLRFEAPSAISAEIGLFQKFSLGAFSHLNGGYIKDVTIGRYCSFARDVQIGHGFHPVDWLSVSPLQYSRDYRGWLSFLAQQGVGGAEVPVQDFVWSNHTVIGNDVWLGNHVIIKDGVTIGDGVIVGAGSVVTKSIAPYMVIAGSPAKPIRSRFNEPMVERLMRLKWWDYRFNDLGGIDFSNIEYAVSQLEDRIASWAIERYVAPVLTSADLTRPTE